MRTLVGGSDSAGSPTHRDATAGAVREPDGRWRDPGAPVPANVQSRAAVGLAFALIAGVYVLEAPPQPAWGDGLGFLYASEAGVAPDTNASAHVLYHYLVYGAAQALPFWPNAGVLVGLSVVSALGALGVVYRMARTVASASGALFGTGVLAFAFTFWRHAVTIEVYAFNLVFVALVVYLAVRGADARDERDAVALAALWGVSLLVHIQNLLLGPLALYYLWRARPGAGRVLWATGAFVATAGWLVALPLALGTHGLGDILFDRNASAVLGWSAATLARGAALAVAYALYNFHVWLLPIAVGAVALWRRRPAVARALGLVVGAYGVFAVRYPVTDSYVFYLGAYVCAAPAAAAGFDVLLRRVSEATRLYAVALSLTVGPLLYAAAVPVARATAPGQRLDQEKGYKGGVAFYLYPGMAGAPDPLDLARAGPRAASAPKDEWNVWAARRFLELDARSRRR